MQTDESDVTSLFREQALTARRSDWLGEVVFLNPLPFKIMAAIAAFSVVSLMVLTIFGTYTRKSTAIGQLVSATGIAEIHSPQPGVVTLSKVYEGKHLKKGDVLFVLSSDRQSGNEETQARISAEVQARKQTLTTELALNSKLSRQDFQATRDKIARFSTEIATIDGMITIQKQRVATAQDLLGRYQKMLTSEFVSQSDVDQRMADLLDQQSRLVELERERTSTGRDLASAQSDLRDLPLKSGNAAAELERQVHAANEDLSSSEEKRQISITAPFDGIATGNLVQVGQNVEPDNVMLSILPSQTRLQAYLYATSKVIGFVKVGDPVELRYEAYPYQRFGVYDGQISAISRNALEPSAFTGATQTLLQRATPDDRGAPLYRITVTLSSQSVTAFGKPVALEVGMLLEADMLGDTRPLYQWLLEPLYALDLPDVGETGK